MHKQASLSVRGHLWSVVMVVCISSYPQLFLDLSIVLFWYLIVFLSHEPGFILCFTRYLAQYFNERW
jgi:hypothetical protein